MLSRRHAELLEARGLDIELVERCGVETCEGRHGDWISIPYLSNGVIVNHKYRTISGEKQFSQDANAPQRLWNEDALRDPTLRDMPVIITEGEFDAMAAIQAGFPRTVSVPNGAPAQEIGAELSTKYEYLSTVLKLLSGVSPIIIAADSDNAGSNLLNDLALRLGKERCKWLRYPRECKDLNDALARYGAKGVVETINRADWVKVDGIYRMSELPPIPYSQPLDCGMPGLAKHYRLRRGDLCAVTGIPSHGKTAFVNEVACRMVLAHKWSVAIASFEQKPQLDHRRNLRTYFNRKFVIHQTAEELREADKWIDRNFTFIVPSDEDEVTLEWTLEKCRAAIVQNFADLVVVDPWNEMDHVRPTDMTLTEYTGFAIKEFKRLAGRFNVHVIIVAHPAKMKREGGSIPIPTLYDISDSAHWFNKPDVGIIVHRDDERVTKIRVQKTRYHDEIGLPGDLLCHFNPNSLRYNPLTDEPYLEEA